MVEKFWKSIVVLYLCMDFFKKPLLFLESLKIKYYEDKFFTSRLLPPTFIPTQEPYDPKGSADVQKAESESAE